MGGEVLVLLPAIAHTWMVRTAGLGVGKGGLEDKEAFELGALSGPRGGPAAWGAGQTS